MNRFRSFALIILITTMIPMLPWAGFCFANMSADESEIEMLGGGSCGCSSTWEIDSTGKLTISGEGMVTDCPWLDYYKTDIREAVIESGITELRGSDFDGCTNLAKVTLPDGLKAISDFAFCNTSLTEVIIPDSVESFGAYSFSDCKELTAVAIPRDLKSIGFGAFCRDVKLQEIILPDGVNIDDYAFDDCISLRSVSVNGNIGKEVFRNCKKLQSVTLGSDVKAIGEFAFIGCESLEAITLPDSIIELGKAVFSYCSALTTANIPEGVEEIPLQTFAFCTNLKNISIKDNITFIDEGAFTHCSSIKNIDFPDGLKNIGPYAFANCEALESIILPEGLETIGEHAFSSCSSIKKVSIPSTVTSIGELAWQTTTSLDEITVDDNNPAFRSINGILYNREATELIKAPAKIAGSIVIPGTVKTITNEAFYSCENLTSVTINEGVKQIGNNAFASCSNLLEIIIPDSVISIGEGAFNSCFSLERMVLPSSLTEISDSLFAVCHNLNYVYIPKSVEKIGSSAFRNCTNLETVDIDPGNKALTFEKGILYNASKTEVLGCINSTASDFIIPDGVKRIQSSAFYGQESIEKLTLPDSLETIESESFRSCINLKTICFGDNLVSIGNSAFADCESLMEMNLPAGLRTIGSFSFGNCSKLQSVTIPKSVKNIDASAFLNCEMLADINGCEGLVEVGADAFRNTAFINSSENWDGESLYLANVLIKANESIADNYQVKDGTTVLADSAFENCTKLEKVLLNKGLKYIGSSCFKGCWNLNEVKLPAGLKRVGEAAFYKYEGRDSGNYDTIYCNITVPGGLEYIGKRCFDELTNVWFEGDPPASYKDAFTGGGWLTFYYPSSITEWQEVVESNQVDFQGNDITWKTYEPDHIHHYSIEADKAPNCTEDGWTKYTCDECGESYTDIIDSLSHDWNEWIVAKEATEDEEGLEQRVCRRDKSHIEKRVTTKLSHAHKLEKVGASKATCDKDGNIEYWACRKCGKFFADYTAEIEITGEEIQIKATGHDWMDGRITKEPAVGREGEMTYTCSNCGQTYGEPIPALTEEQAEAYGAVDSAEEAAGLAQQKAESIDVNSSEQALADADKLVSDIAEEASAAVEAAEVAAQKAVAEYGEGSEAAEFAKTKVVQAKQTRAKAIVAAAEVKAVAAEAAMKKAETAKSSASAAAVKPGKDAVKAAQEAEVAAKESLEKATSAKETADAALAAVVEAGYSKDSEEYKAAARAMTAAEAAKASAETKLAEATAAVTAAEEAKAKEDTKEIVDLPKVTISKVTAGKRSATVKWKKVSKKNQKKISKIQIQYSTDKKFMTNVKTTTAKKKAVSRKISKLKSKKKYYFRIRSYKKTGGRVHVSKWSKVKSAKAK